MHIIICGESYSGSRPGSSTSNDLNLFLKDWIIENNLKSLILTSIYMYRDVLISKEKMELMCSGKFKRQSHHITQKGNDTYKESVTENAEKFFESLQHKKIPKS